MIFGFQTDDEPIAACALLAYGAYRSRPDNTIKVTPAFWDSVQERIRLSGMQANDFDRFLGRLSHHFGGASIRPELLSSVDAVPETRPVETPDGQGFVVRALHGAVPFDVLLRIDGRSICAAARERSVLIVLLLRTRIDAEKAEREIKDMLDA